MPPSPRYTVRLPPALHTLVSDAVRQGQQVSDIIREALEAYFGVRQPPRPTTQSELSDTAVSSSDTPSDTLTDILADTLTRLAALEQRFATLEAAQPSVRRRPTQRASSSDTSAAPPSFDSTKFLLGTLCPQGHDVCRHGPEPSAQKHPILP